MNVVIELNVAVGPVELVAVSGMSAFGLQSSQLGSLSLLASPLCLACRCHVANAAQVGSRLP